MYEQFFGFKHRPFSSTPDPRYYIPLEGMEAAREKLLRVILRAEGPGLLVGPTGTGKSMLLRLIASQLQSRCEVVLLTHGRFPSVKALLQAILCELGQPFRGMDEGELRLSLIDYIKHVQSGRPLAILVDEADTLSFRLLEEIRTLLNIPVGGEMPVRVVLAGGTALEERMTAPKLQVLSQRIAARCYLDALNRAETLYYIEQQIARTGRSAGDLFPEPTRESVYHATGGVLRLINQVCDHALLLAFADGLHTVTPELVQEAWSDLQQFPIPWDPVPQTKSESGVVEFGTWSEPAGVAGREVSAEQIDGTLFLGETLRPRSEQTWGQPRTMGASLSPHLDASPREADFGARETSSASEPMTDPEDRDDVPASDQSAANAQDSLERIQSRPDPVSRLENVVTTLSELENEFASTVSQKPEVELVFYDWGDPFAESFAQEIPVTRRRPPANENTSLQDTLQEQPIIAGESETDSKSEKASSTRRSSYRSTDEVGGANEASEPVEVVHRAESHFPKQNGDQPLRDASSEAKHEAEPDGYGRVTASKQGLTETAADQPEASISRSPTCEPPPGGSATIPHAPEAVDGENSQGRGAQTFPSPRVSAVTHHPCKGSAKTLPPTRRRFKSLFSQLRNDQVINRPRN